MASMVFFISLQQEKMWKYFRHSLPSATGVEGPEAWNKDREREGFRIYLRFFSDSSVTEDISL